MRIPGYIPASLAFAAVFASALQADTLTTEQAYAALKHQRPVFSPVISSLPENESAYLEELFGVIDQAVVQRVDLMSWLAGKGTRPEPFDDYDAILYHLRALRPPKKLADMQFLVIAAVEEQRDLLRQWKQQPRTFVWETVRKNPLVLSSSAKLHHAYDHVIRLYPQEHEKNREAFYDYFCCLDML